MLIGVACNPLPLSGAGPACGPVAGMFGTSFPCDSYGHTVAYAHPMEVYSGNYHMEGFGWTPGQDGCNARRGFLQLPGFDATIFAEAEVYGPNGGAYVHVADLGIDGVRDAGDQFEYDCNITGNAMYCPPIRYRTITNPGGADAVITVDIVSNHTFANRAQSNAHFVGIVVDCTGSMCSIIGQGVSFPCVSSGSTVLRAIPMDVYQGDYNLKGASWSRDGCNAASLLDMPGIADEILQESATWTDDHFGARTHIIAESTGLSYYCNLTGDFFQCPAVELTTVTQDGATLEVMMGPSEGTYSTRTTYDTKIDVSINCRGSGCEGVANGANTAFPCTSTVRTTGTAVPIEAYVGDCKSTAWCPFAHPPAPDSGGLLPPFLRIGDRSFAAGGETRPASES